MQKALILVTALMVGLVGCSKDSGWAPVSDDDPQIVAARQEARDSYPEFLKLLKARRGMTVYTVEVQYEDGVEIENLELDVLKADENEITGRIVGYPRKVKLQNGATVTVPVANLFDWRVESPEGEVKGGFVSDVRAKLQRSGG